MYSGPRLAVPGRLVAAPATIQVEGRSARTRELRRYGAGAAVRAYFRDGRTFSWDAEPESLRDDAGRAWRESGEGLPNSAVQCLAISPSFAQDRTLFAGTEDVGLYRSLNGGRTWSPVSEAYCNRATARWAQKPLAVSSKCPRWYLPR